MRTKVDRTWFGRRDAIRQTALLAQAARIRRGLANVADERRSDTHSQADASRETVTACTAIYRLGGPGQLVTLNNVDGFLARTGAAIRAAGRRTPATSTEATA